MDVDGGVADGVGSGRGQKRPSSTTADDDTGVRATSRHTGQPAAHAPHPLPGMRTHDAIAALVLPPLVAAMQPLPGASGARRLRHASLVCSELVRLGTLSVATLTTQLLQHASTIVPLEGNSYSPGPSGDTDAAERSTRGTASHPDATNARVCLQWALLVRACSEILTRVLVRASRNEIQPGVWLHSTTILN